MGNSTSWCKALQVSGSGKSSKIKFSVISSIVQWWLLIKNAKIGACEVVQTHAKPVKYGFVLFL